MEGGKEGRREREPSLTVTQHYPAGQDGGGGSHKRGGDEEREEAQDAEVGEVFSFFFQHFPEAWPSCLPHSATVFMFHFQGGGSICKWLLKSGFQNCI